MATAALAEKLLTAEEFGDRPDPGHPEELVRGKIVTMPPPRTEHGKICFEAGYLIRRYLDEHPLGFIVSNDSGVITERQPDTVRGADIAYYSYERVPKGPFPKRYLDVAPDLVVEVLSPSDRWPMVLHKVAEYLGVGVSVVLIIDPDRRTIQVHSQGEITTLGRADDLTLPTLLTDFRVRVERFFE